MAVKCVKNNVFDYFSSTYLYNIHFLQCRNLAWYYKFLLSDLGCHYIVILEKIQNSNVLTLMTI